MVKGSQYDHLVHRYSAYAPAISTTSNSRPFAVGLRYQVSKVRMAVAKPVNLLHGIMRECGIIFLTSLILSICF